MSYIVYECCGLQVDSEAVDNSEWIDDEHAVHEDCPFQKQPTTWERIVRWVLCMPEPRPKGVFWK